MAIELTTILLIIAVVAVVVVTYFYFNPTSSLPEMFLTSPAITIPNTAFPYDNSKRPWYCYDKSKIKDSGHGYVFSDASIDVTKPYAAAYNGSNHSQCSDQQMGTPYAYGQCIDCSYPGSNGTICLSSLDGKTSASHADVVLYCTDKLGGKTQKIIKPS